MPSVRTVVRTLIVALLLAAPLLAALETPANARTYTPVSLTDRGVSHSLSVSIDSVSPNWAQPGKRITVHGTVTNNTGSSVSGLRVAMQTESTAAFSSRSAMEGYVAGVSGSNAYLATSPAGAPYPLPGVIRPGATVNWSVSFPASAPGYPQFGVYPLAAVVYSSSSSPLATERTLLPYWPGNSAADPLRVSWVWPLVDQPQRGPCPQTLASDALAASLRPSGRLGGLLSTGLKWAGQADLTWAVDPALLADAQAMTTPYKVGGNARCTGAIGESPSADASAWLSTLRTAAAGEPMFVTPYADADVSALAHSGMTNDLRSAYALGEQVAGQSLQRPFGKSGTGDGGAPSMAWSAGGAVDESLLTSLASTARANTVLVGSADEPSMASTVNKTGAQTRLLLADSGLTGILGTSSPRSGVAGQFATEQDFLAETAMIVDEMPFAKNRSIVIAPPRRWAPSPAEADALLAASVHAPWLRPAKLSSVASSSAGQVTVPGQQVNSAALTRSYTKLVRAVDSSLGLYQSLLYQPGPAVTQQLRESLLSTVSTAWRGSGGGAGTETLIDLADFARDSQRKVQIIAGKKILLAGASGNIPVSVQNGTSQPVQVRVQADLPYAGQLAVGKFDALVTVPAGKTGTVKMPVRATGIETTTLRLQLVTRNGSPLAWTSQPMTVQVTRYGRALIILICAALGVVVLTSGVRWVRQWLNDTRAGSGGTG